jgi:hypothetical protein
LIKQDIYRLEVPKKNPLGPSIFTLKNEGQEGKTGLF